MMDYIGPVKLRLILALDDAEAEDMLYKRLCHVTSVWESSYAEVGLLCRAVQTHELWKQRTDPDIGQPCSSFSRWLKVAAPRSYSTCYAAMKDVEDLKDMPEEAIAAMPTGSFSVMKSLSTQVRNQPDVIEAAKGKTGDLVDHVRKNYPDQALERTKLLKFTPEESAVSVIENALRMAEEHGARNRNEALELLAVTSMETWRYEAEVESALK